MHSLEVVLDDDTDRQIREQWRVLKDADLPSQSRHQGASNRPHITLGLTNTISADVGERLTTATSRLPLPITIGGLLVFGSRRLVLARLVLPSVDLLDLQLRTMSALDDAVDPHDTFAPGRWTPHVTLGRRLTPDQLGVAVEILGDLPTVSGWVTRARRWDINGKCEQWVDPPES